MQVMRLRGKKSKIRILKDAIDWNLKAKEISVLENEFLKGKGN